MTARTIPNISASEALSADLIKEVQDELGEACDHGARVYFPARNPEKKRRRKKALTDRQKRRIIERKDQGESATLIANEYRVDPSYIHRIYRNHKSTGDKADA